MADHNTLRFAANSTSVLRRQVLSQLIQSNGKDINAECEYPTVITPAMYQEMYDREGVAARVVDVWPDETWAMLPEVYETEDAKTETAFEKAWEELEEAFHLYSVLTRADRLSGIGRFGIILFGIDDGLDLIEPVKSVETKAPGTVTNKLIYIRAFAESAVDIASYDRDITSPRFSLPVTYTLKFQDDTGTSLTKNVHWTRVLHVADNRGMSEVFGVPRMQSVFNRLLDLRKILGGSGEMFWRGAFPGLALEAMEGYENADMDEAAVKQEIWDYQNGLQRYLAPLGMRVKSLTPQLASPVDHVQVQLDSLAMSRSIPKRILFGSEQAQLASEQDTRTWRNRVVQRQTNYVIPYLVRPFVDRLIALGVLPAPVDGFSVEWQDMESRTEGEKAEVTAKWAEAFAKYVAGNVDQMVPPEEFLGLFAGLTTDEIQNILKAQLSYLADMPEEEPTETPVVPTETPTPPVEEDA